MSASDLAPHSAVLSLTAVTAARGALHWEVVNGGSLKNAIRKLQIYYQRAIRRNSKVSSMNRAILASLQHCFSTDEPHILRFRLRMMRFSPDVVHVPGKNQITADAFSRAPALIDGHHVLDEEIQEIESSVNATVDSLPATTKRLEEIRSKQKADVEIAQIRNYCVNGWPSDVPHSPATKQYWISREHFTIVDDLLLYDDRLVIPACMREDILNYLHMGHLGVSKCIASAQRSVWWPNITASIANKVSMCHTCAKNRPDQKEPVSQHRFQSDHGHVSVWTS